MADELPPVPLGGKLCRLLLDDYGPDGLRAATLPDIIALVAALPDEAVRGLLLERWRKIVDRIEEKWCDAEEQLASERRGHEETKREERERCAKHVEWYANSGSDLTLTEKGVLRACAGSIRLLKDTARSSKSPGGGT